MASKARKLTKLDTDSVVGKVNAAKMVRSNAETKKEGVTSEEPGGWLEGGETNWDFRKGLWGDVMSGLLVLGCLWCDSMHRSNVY